jgi:Rhodopirellula transposase DDE domain
MSCSDSRTAPAANPSLPLPPGTSKWNKIEHRMFSFVSLNGRGKPLETLEVIINLIAATQTSTGLKLYAQLDDRTYERGIDITDDQLAAVSITRHAFHGDSNYTVSPSLIES